MSDIKFDGRIRKAARFGEGMQRGTVAWVRLRRQRRAEIQRWKDLRTE